MLSGYIKYYRNHNGGRTSSTVMVFLEEKSKALRDKATLLINDGETQTQVFGFRSEPIPPPHLLLWYMEWLSEHSEPYIKPGRMRRAGLKWGRGQGLSLCTVRIPCVYVKILDHDSMDYSGNGSPLSCATEEKTVSIWKTPQTGRVITRNRDLNWVRKYGCHFWLHHSLALCSWASHSTAWASVSSTIK